MFINHFSMFRISPNIEKRTSSIKKRFSLCFGSEKIQIGFSYWCNEAKAEIDSLGFSVYFLENKYPVPLIVWI